METLGQRIRRLRLAAGYKRQVHFAKAIGIDPTSLNQIEQGYRVPKLPNVEKMAITLGTTVGAIYDGEAKAAQPSPPRPVLGAPSAASRKPQTKKEPPADGDQAQHTPSPDLSALVDASVQTAMRNFLVDVLGAVSVALAGRETAAAREGGRSKSDRAAARRH